MPSAAEPQHEPADGLAEALALWDQGDHRAAVPRLLDCINQEAPARQRPLVLQLVGWMRHLGDVVNAEQLLRQLQAQHPNDPAIRGLIEDIGPQHGQGEVDPNREILAAWPEPEEPHPATPPMPSCVTGRVINLERATDRWQAMQRQIDQLGWRATHDRYPAQGATAEEARSLGLRSAGELGLWRTTKELLSEWLACNPAADDVLHILEDDAIVNPALPKLIQPLLDCEANVDLLFTESFLTLEQYHQFQRVETWRQASKNWLIFLQGRHYRACASSYLVRKRGAERILNMMQEKEAAARLRPIDIAYREMIRGESIAATITLPFFSTINPSDDSAIQTDLHAEISLAKNADLSLRRLLYTRTWDPASTGSILQELSSVMGRRLKPQQITSLVTTILRHGREQDWLGVY